jgi:hypothetical protein
MWRGFFAGTLIVGLLFGGSYLAATLLAPQPWERFYNSYISFSLPPDWSCQTAETEFVCRSSDGPTARRSIVVLAAKKVGPDDNFDSYRTYLSTPQKPPAAADADAALSTVLNVETRVIADVTWMFARHQGSLVPGFESHYYAAIHKDVAVLFTFSFNLEEGAHLAPIGERIAASMLVYI